MKTLDNLNSSKAHSTGRPRKFSRRIQATSIVSILLLGASLILTACGQAPAEVADTYIPAATTDTPEPTATFVPTDTPAPTATDTPEPTATPVPLEGRLFFDMNGSGLMDQASFIYDPARLTDDRQPLQPDLLAAVLDYVNAHPDLQAGDLITLDEPGLTGYTVCVADNCAVTAAGGTFSIANPDTSSSPRIAITDPNAGTPALEMRYVNLWNGSVTVPAYTKDIDAATMLTLTLVPGCDTDASALVCKQDADTLLVKDQHLNDTEIKPATSQVRVQLGGKNEIGLMQGFLTLPFVKEQVPEPFIYNYFDIVGYRIFDDTNTYQSTMDGIFMNYNGTAHQQVDISLWSRLRNFEHLTLVGDSHTGNDFLVSVGSTVVSGDPTSQVWLVRDDGTVNLMVPISSSNYDSGYGHLSVSFVSRNQPVYRGQIIGLSGDRGNENIPQLHFHIAEAVEGGGWYYLDPYRYEITLTPLPDNFWGNPVSLWTTDNNTSFSR